MLSKRGTFEEDCGGLDEEEERWPAISAGGRQRDDQLVNDAADEKADEKSWLRSEACCQRAKQEAMRQIAKGGVPCRPQKSLTLLASIGQAISGFALTPHVCQIRLSR